MYPGGFAENTYPHFQKSQEFALDDGVILDTTSIMQEECSFQRFSVEYEFDFWNENVLHMKVSYLKKNMTHKLCQNANFENGGTTMQMGNLNVLWTVCQYLYYLGYTTGLAISRCKKSSLVVLRFKENAGGQLEHSASIYIKILN